MVRIGGIDYSLTSPSVCVYNGDKDNFTFDRCKIFYLSSVKKFSEIVNNNLEGQATLKEYACPEERYDYISDWALDILISYDIQHVAVEDYSYGSTGKVFHIAENTGLLKWKLWQSEINYMVVPPTVIKKFASGKGNANKEKMYESFLFETKRKLQDEFNIKSEKIGNPVSDIVDSYYICKYALDNL